MLNIYQQTLSHSVNFEGVGLHTGLKSKITIKPGKEDQGILFIRTDLSKNNQILANYKNVSSAKLCTTLMNKNKVKVSTVEHLLAALYISEIDNAIIEINSEEVPILDGSSKEFLNGLRNIEIVKQGKKRKYLKIKEKVDLKLNDKEISISPSGFSFQIEFKLNYENEIIGKQKNSINLNQDNLENLYSSRTFCLLEDIDNIKKMGLAKGGTLENALVVDKNKILNSDGLRNSKEFVNHKILDLVGDFMLSGYRILGYVNCYQGGHQLSCQFLSTLFKNSSSKFEILELETNKITSISHKKYSSRVAVNA